MPIYKRSWIDAGTEVRPGDRKFTDYAFSPSYLFTRENKNSRLIGSQLLIWAAFRGTQSGNVDQRFTQCDLFHQLSTDGTNYGNALGPRVYAAQTEKHRCSNNQNTIAIRERHCWL
jgi:hypothetical protein